VCSSDLSPFGVQLDGRTIQGDFYRYGYQGSEKDDEAKGGGNSYTTFYRQLDPRVGRWFSVDPVFQPWQSPYNSMDGNPISLNDQKGNQPITPLPPIDLLGWYLKSGYSKLNSEGDSEIRQEGYAMLHPISAMKIKEMGLYAGNFSVNMGIATGRTYNYAGTFLNATRHTLWSALCTKSIGKDLTKLGTDSHETHTKNVDWSQRNFNEDEIHKADHLIDLMNNQIGREIGDKNKDLTNTQIAIKVLDYYKDHGLWEAKKNENGSYTIAKTKLSQSDYDKSIKEISSKGEDGLEKKKKVENEKKVDKVKYKE
jgi:RHS repeat-associated protein